MEFNFKDFIPGFLKGGPEQPRELDKTKAKLKELSETIQPETIGEVWGKLRPSFDADMEELGITDAAKKEELWQQVRHEVESNQLENSEELRNVDAFINNSQNLPELKKIIESTDPKAKADQWLKSLSEKIPGWGLISGGIAGYLISWAEDSKKDGKDSFLGSQLRKLASWLGGEKEKAPEPNEAETLVKNLSEKFKAKGVVLESASLASGMQDMLKNDKAEALGKLADDALAPAGKLTKLLEALNIHRTEKPLELRITDLRFQKNFSIDQINALVSTIKGEKDAKFQMKKEGLLGARELLDAALLMKDGKMEEALAAFKKPEKAV